jgi:hypothetical protein
VITEDEEEEGQAKGLQGTMKGLILRLQSGYVSSSSNLRGRDFRKRLLRDQARKISLGFRFGKLVRDHVRKIRLRFRFENCFQKGFGKSALVPGSENGSRSASALRLSYKVRNCFGIR